MAFASYTKKVKATGVDDMVLISKLAHEEITENLKKRHANDVIYTYISDVLISVNPFKAMPQLFNNDQIEQYKGRARHELPPHVYALAESAYRRMVNDGENQCVIISGESGAGKTEASKLIMQYIAAVSGKGEGVERVKRIILESNPLLEAFGNAKTVRNNNSSRFGKYFEIQFDRKGDPQGGRITNYLLEKSRVVYQMANERNFHIFYQLCYGASKAEREQFGVMEPENFHYLNQSGCYKIENVDDAKDFEETKQAMEVIGINKDERTSMLKLVAGILWLGNIQFKEDAGGRTDVADEATMNFAAHLLSVQPDALKRALLFRVVTSGGRRGSTYNVPQSPEQAGAIRDALAKALYDRMFTWLVGRINNAMKSDTQNKVVIGVLDIFGFEIFDANGFEQFCINYVNEKLQQIFIDLTLAQEEAEYKAEGLKWEPIKYFNNKIVCDLIEATNPPGIFAILDDTCHTTHSMESSKADEKFVQKADGAINNPHFIGRGSDFIIKHYAGQVTYKIDGFTDKNKDNVFATLIECMQSTKDKFILQFFPENVQESTSNKKPTTAGYKIKQSCQALVETIKKCNPHYIRCIKPNETKLPRDFDQKRVLHQVQYLGLLENIRVRRAGFAYRCVFDKFIERFNILSKKTWPQPWKGESSQGCSAILNDVAIDTKQWQLGKTKVFLKSPETLFNLEEMKERKYYDSASMIARTYKAYKLRKYFLDLRANATNLMENKKERRRLSVNRIYQGDYVNYQENAQLQEIMKPYKDEGGVVFADLLLEPHRKTLGGIRIEKLYLLVTAKALYIIERVKEKKQFIMKLKKRATVDQISCISMSCLQDNYVIISFGPNTEDVFAECANKTEFLTILNDQYRAKAGRDITRNFSNNLQYNANAKGKKKAVVAVKDVSGKNKLAALSGASSKWTISIVEGLPADTKPKNVLAKKQTTTQPAKKVGAPAAQASAPRGHPGLQVTMESAPFSAPPSISVPQTSAPKFVSQVNPSPASAPVVKAATSPATSTPVAKSPSSAAPAPVAKKAPPPPPVKETRPRVKAMFAYDAAAEDELTMKVGDIIVVVEKDESGWWTGMLNGKTGLFPGNYTQPV